MSPFAWRRWVVPALVLASPWAGLAKMTPEQLARLPAPVSHPVNFARDIKPILEASCVKCHGRGKAKGGFRLDDRSAFLAPADSGPAVVVGRSAESYLIELVAGVDPDNVMPQKGSRLKPEQIALLRAWIDQGLPWDEGVTFARQPTRNLRPRSVELPPSREGLDHPVDRLLEPYFVARQIRPGEPVDDRTFARRVHLDVIGLLPTPEEMEAFLRDKRRDKRERLVTRLLADDRRYAEHWLSFWNDLLRNDYRGTGYIDGGRKQISTWLFSALSRNLPYDRFVAALVDPSAESEGFVKGIVWRGTVNASQTPEMQAAQNISQVFMGVNLKCASCHDSFINDWTLADAYGMAGVYATNRLEMFECDKPTGRVAPVKFLYPELGAIDPTLDPAARRKRLAELLTARENGRLSRTIVNRLWQRFFGRGLVEPVDDMERPAWHPDLLDWLAEDLVAHGYDLRHTMKVMLTSRAYQLPAVSLDEQPHEDFVFTGPAVRRMTAEQFRDALGMLTGVWFEAPAAPFHLAAEAGADAREDLIPRTARWIWSAANAATQAPAETVYLRKSFTLDAVPDEAFIVAVCDNGFTLHVNGRRALAGKDFTQPSFADVRGLLRPGENVLAVTAVNHTPANQPPRAGEPPKDSDANPAGFFLHARLRAGPRVLDVSTDSSWTWSRTAPEGWMQAGAAAVGFQPAVELGGPGTEPWKLADKLRSSMSVALVHGEVRASLVPADPLTLALGRPPREQLLTVRPSAATTLQALELTNGETLAGLLKRGAEKLVATAPKSSERLARDLYARALGRPPTDAERKLAREFLGQPARPEQVEDFLWSLAMLPEFQLIY